MATKLLLFLLPCSLVFGQATSYTVTSQFVQSGVTAGGVIGGKIVAASSTFDGTSAIAVHFINNGGAGESALENVTPASGSTWAYFEITTPSVAGTYSLSATHFNGGSLTTNPGPQTVQVVAPTAFSTLQSNYVAQGCGALFHWNMTTFQPNANDGNPGWAVANVAVDTFAPTVSATTLAANMDSWLQAVSAVGCKYAFLTVKHHDGFKLWPSASKQGANPVYGVSSTSWYAANGKPDLVEIFIQKCRDHGINPGLYFSIWDKTYEAQNTGWSYAAYTPLIQAELTELLSHYGQIKAIRTDGWYWHSGGYTNIPLSPIYATIKAIQPDALLIENNHQRTANASAGSPYTSDIALYEVSWGDALAAGNTTPVEGSDTIKWRDSYLFFNSDPSQQYTYTPSFIRPPRDIYNAILAWNGNNATYLLDLAPDATAVIPASEAIALAHWPDEKLYPNNIAAGKAVTSSSNYSGTGTNSVITDNIFGTLNQSFLFSTNTGDPTPYAEVDLGAATTLGRVETFNRNDQYSPGRLRDLTLTLYDAAHALVAQIPGINSANSGYGLYVGDGTMATGPGQLTIPVSAVTARYVRLSRTPTDTATDDGDDLALMEITAFGSLSGTAAVRLTGKMTGSGRVVLY